MFECNASRRSQVSKSFPFWLSLLMNSIKGRTQNMPLDFIQVLKKKHRNKREAHFLNQNLIRCFCHNSGFFSIATDHKWWTVEVPFINEHGNRYCLLVLSTTYGQTKNNLVERKKMDLISWVIINDIWITWTSAFRTRESIWGNGETLQLPYNRLLFYSVALLLKPQSSRKQNDFVLNGIRFFFSFDWFLYKSVKKKKVQ